MNRTEDSIVHPATLKAIKLNALREKIESLPPVQCESVAVPFVTVGNRRGLTYEQIFLNEWLADFVERFRSSFELDPERQIMLFIEPEAA